MAADLQKFQFKSKFMRKFNSTVIRVLLLEFTCCILVALVNCSEDCSKECQHGLCKENTCECYPGWTGKHCQFCTGRVRLWNDSGVITDGIGNYSEDNQCTWLIDPNRPQSLIRIYLDHFATECSWDHLYIYDGGSIYDPLLAVYSGMIVQDHFRTTRIPEVIAKVDGCPSSSGEEECSGHGVCLDKECTCDGGWSGPSCSYQICPSNCSGHGNCNRERHRCFCHSGYTGHDCSQKMEKGWWGFAPSGSENRFASISDLERVAHTSTAIDSEIWIIGGYSFSPKPFVLVKNVSDGIVRRVEADNSKNNPDLRYGHSAVVYNGSIYVYGGTKLLGSETNELWKFDYSQRVWTLIESQSSREGSFRHKKVGEKGSKRHNFGEQNVVKDDPKGEENIVKEDIKGEFAGSIDEGAESRDCLIDSSVPCSPIACVGHAAVVVKDLFMVVIFGYSSLYGPLNMVQEYHFKLNTWKVSRGEGALIDGIYGHSAVWDSDTSHIYVFGGLRSAISNSVVADVLAYNPFTKKWSLRSPAPFPRFLHSATLTSGGMLVFGGNTHNDTNYSYGSSCYSSDFLFYDFHCNSWHTLQKLPNLNTDVARYGQSAVMVRGTMIVVAGFNGRMLGTILHYHPGKCDIHTTKNQCLNAYPGHKCIWNRVLERCEILQFQDKTAHDFCLPPSADRNLNLTVLCSSLTSCYSCLYNSFGCVWCSSGCFYEKCSDYTKGVVTADGCEDRWRWLCKTLKSCNLCHTHSSYCDWSNKECIYSPINATAESSDNLTSHSSAMEPILVHSESSENSLLSTTVAPISQLGAQSCPVSCALRTTCMNCTQGPCMWCFNQQRCISNNSYLVSFPFGQCREWTTESRRCFYIEKGLSKCMVHQTCKSCQDDVGCGWCDDGSNTGTGVCLEGGQNGPMNPSSGDLLPRRCPKNQWYFTTCPACNCNGHSHCVNDTCVQPCANSTRGRHCGKCKEAFYGRPINGGLCKPCQCNDHGLTCEHDTGVCHCHTKGVIGDHCQRCDTQNNYYGEPLKGSCFYDLQIDYQFTFNLSKQEDIHIRQINFYNVPSKAEVDTDFDIQCSKPARIKLSAKQTGGHETWIIKNFTGMSIKRRFSSSDYIFGSAENNTTFHVYVFNITPPIEIIISFSQHPKLDLIQFFSIFSLCFMVLLLMAFVMWKIKQKYDLYTRRQRLMVEIRAMASRPFRSVFLELQLNEDVSVICPRSEIDSTQKEALCTSMITCEQPDLSDGSILGQKSVTKEIVPSHNLNSDKQLPIDYQLSSNTVNGNTSCNGMLNSLHPHMLLNLSDTSFLKNMNNPSPVALEMCAGNMAAVLSMLVQLPTGGARYTPSGHPGGLAVATALVSLGPPRSLEASHTKDHHSKAKWKEPSVSRSQSSRM